MISAVYWLLAGVSLGFVLLAMTALLCWAALWPDIAVPVLQGQPETGAASVAVTPGPVFAEHEWRSVIEAIPEPSILLAPDLAATAVNAAATELLALRPGQHISTGIRAPGLLAALEDARRTGSPQSAEVHLAVPVERTLSVRVTPLAVGEPVTGPPRLLVVFRDRTEEQQLAQLRADFVANASHELRTPLASVKGFVETLQGPAKDDPVARERFLGIMHDQASRMSRLIEDLLSLSRVEMREHVAPRERVDLADIVEQAGKALEPLAQAAGRQLLVGVAARPVSILGDRDELTQLIQNLVQNGIKYGKPGGRVEVAVTQAAGRISLVVSDDGIGIAPEHLPRLTERFYRVNAKDSRERGGTGLGLAIVKHIVNRHRGELRIASQLGKGSTFTVFLPGAGANA